VGAECIVDNSVLDRLGALDAICHDMGSKLGDMQTDIAVLVERSGHDLENCPLRVVIARNTNGAADARERAIAATSLANKAVDLTVENRVDIAKLVMITAGGGVSGGVVVVALNYLLKLV